MSKPIEHLGEIINRIIDLEPSEDKMNIIELETSEGNTYKTKWIKMKETIRNVLDELKIMKTNRKKELEEIESKLMSLKENEKMASLK